MKKTSNSTLFFVVLIITGFIVYLVISSINKNTQDPPQATNAMKLYEPGCQNISRTVMCSQKPDSTCCKCKISNSGEYSWGGSEYVPKECGSSACVSGMCS
jgi:hypothetical protein